MLAHWNNSLQVDISLCQTQYPDSNPTSFCSNSLRQSALVQKKQNSIFIVLSLTRLQIKSTIVLTWSGHANHYATKVVMQVRNFFHVQYSVSARVRNLQGNCQLCQNFFQSFYNNQTNFYKVLQDHLRNWLAIGDQCLAESLQCTFCNTYPVMLF